MKSKKAVYLRISLALLAFCSGSTFDMLTVTASTSVSGEGTTDTFNKNGATTSGTNATAVGDGAGANGDQTVAIGYNASASNSASIAIGGTSSNDETNRSATASGSHSIAIGAGSYAQGNWAIAQGTKSLAYGLGSLAIGTGAKAGESSIDELNDTKATAIGYDANASKANSTAIGTGSEATAEGATAVGQQAAANAEGSVAVGTNSLALTNGAIAVGSSSMAVGNGSITIGMSAQSGFYAEDLTKGQNGVAIGNEAWIPEAKNAVALGYGSVALEDAVVSVGSDGTSVTISGDDGEETIETQKITRRIVNVANGTKNTDAATVGQLVKNDTYVYDATTKTIKVKTNGDTGTNASGFTLDLSTLSTGGGNSLIIGDDTNHWLDVSWNGAADSTSVTRGVNSTAYGYKANASVQNSVAIGYGATAFSGGEEKGQSIALGYNASASNGASIAIGGTWFNDESSTPQSATASGVDSIALGGGSYAQGNWSIAQGGKSAAYGYGSIAIGQKATAGNDTLEASPDTDAIAIGYEATASVKKSLAVGRKAKASQQGAVAFGNKAQAFGEDSIAIGTDSASNGEGAIVIGANAISGLYENDSTKGQYGVAIGNGAMIIDAKNAVALGYNSIALEDGVVSVGSDGSSFTITDDEGNSETITTPTITRRIVNVANGTKNTDAATVGQLVKNDTYVYDATTKTIKVKTNGDTGTNASGFTLDLSTLSTGGDVSTKADTYASNIGVNLKDSVGNPASPPDVETNLNAWGTALGTGTVSAASGQLVTGAIVYNETRKNVSGTYISSGNDVGTNLSLLDTQVKTNADTIQTHTSDITGLKDLSNLTDAGKSTIKSLSQDAVKVKAGTNIGVSESTDANGNKVYTVSTDLENATEMTKKVSTDASNIGVNLKDSAGNPASPSDVETNLNAWGTALGTGTVSAASGQLVTGATVYNETRKNASGTYISSGNDVGTNLSKLDNQVKTNKDAISEIEKTVTAQQKVISYDKDSGIIGIGTNSDIVADTVTIVGASGNRTLTGLKDGVNANDAATVGQMNTAITKAISGNTYSGDGVTIEVDSATRTISAKTGAVSSVNNGLVTGATVYEAVEKSKVDGASYTIDANKRTATVLNKDGSTAFTLTVEGSAAGAYTSGDHIYISDDSTISVKTDGKIESGNTGIVTGGAVYEKIGDTSKLTAAGLGDTLSDSVLGVNERVLSVNNRMNDLANDINKVGAGAAALAALRPEGFSPDDKWSFAVGYGHYKNANSGAFGAFYKPNQDTTISAGSTIGNGNPMMNLGFSFKLGTRSAGPGIYSSNLEIVREMNAMKAGEERMAEVIHAQAKQISNLEAENAQMKAQIAEILKKLELSAAVQKAM